MKLDDNQMVNWLLLNVIAGGDTTSATTRTVVYNLAKSPGNYERLIKRMGTAQPSLPALWTDLRA